MIRPRLLSDDEPVHHGEVDPVPTLKIDSELALARLALDLGAEGAGGPLAAEETALIHRARTLPADAAAAEEARARLRRGEDPLGHVFGALRTSVDRRARGQFWTPSTIVTPMIDWARASNPTRLVDPGCGSGRFSAEAARRDPAIKIIAIDRDPLATLMTRAALSVLGAKGRARDLWRLPDGAAP